MARYGGRIERKAHGVISILDHLVIQVVAGVCDIAVLCIPNNPEQTALRDTIDDRLFKIRHCEKIAGIFRKLPLFEPPIDPALLVQAAAQGLSLSGVLNDLNSPIPTTGSITFFRRPWRCVANSSRLAARFFRPERRLTRGIGTRSRNPRHDDTEP
jgi:hypothetical protein